MDCSEFALQEMEAVALCSETWVSQPERHDSSAATDWAVDAQAKGPLQCFPWPVVVDLKVVEKICAAGFGFRASDRDVLGLLRWLLNR